ncbi:MAG: BNR-4 repeat-containing protein, partial [Campylobacterota bacterium]|nr:BNR-4 repeat-containing protein [Campylobacterota bacterium]
YVFSLDKQSRRPYINKINSIDNTMQTSLLDKNEDEIYSVFDDSHHRFAIAIDKEGYIHVIGDMHHGSGGSGKGGSYRQLTDNPLPQRFLNIEYGEQMYWVSDNPEDVSSFTFVGNDANRHFPCNRTTYNYFRKDNNGVLYMAGRQSVRQNKSHESGTLGLCLAKYDTSTKTWNLLGGVPEGGYEGLDIGDEKVYESILWEPHGYNKTDVGSTWYQSYSSNFKFDTNNTMHLVATINADTVHNGGTNMVYSYSKDGGNTFNRLDRVTLNKFPLRVNGTSDDNSSNQIDSAINQNKDSVIYEAWYPGLFFDSNSSPAVIYKNIEDINNSIIKYRYFDKTSSEWKDSNILTRMEDIRADSYTLLDGSMLIIGSKGIQRIDNFGEDGITYKFDSKIKASFTDSYFLREVDIDLLRTKNILRGIAQIDGRFAIITVY